MKKQNNLTIKDFAKVTDIKMSDEKLLKIAMTHRSTSGHQKYTGQKVITNEQLEFLGDAVLEFIVSNELYEKYKDEGEGHLTKLRAALVCQKNLSRVAKEMGLGQFIIFGRGEESSGGHEKNYILANTVEALIGAIYIDQGLDQAEKYIKAKILTGLKTIIDKKLYVDAKTQLQEYVQARIKVTPRYKTLKIDGPDHAKKFTVAVTINKEKYMIGTGRTKQSAQDKAAKKTLSFLKKFGFRT